ncbi:MAG: 50S ribosome-binding GTPase [Lachnospiraceae bacterium]|nr:50S ribosome-binding GTPase [Lachnospiraceae bacterium]
MDFDIYRKQDIEEKLKKAKLPLITLMVTGVTGAGKSTTLNAIFHRKVTEIGSGVNPETLRLSEYRLNDVVRVWDTPGLGDGVINDQRHKKKIVYLLNSKYSDKGHTYGLVDMVLVLIEGSNRDMGTTYTLLNEVIAPNIQGKRILVAINQADVAMKGRHWNNQTKLPDATLIAFLEEQASSIQRRVKEATGIIIPKPVYYSAEYGYNLKVLFDFIVDHIPDKRRRMNRLP